LLLRGGRFDAMQFPAEQRVPIKRRQSAEEIDLLARIARKWALRRVAVQQTSQVRPAIFLRQIAARADRDGEVEGEPVVAAVVEVERDRLPAAAQAVAAEQVAVH